MKEKFENRKLTGSIRVKMDGHPTLDFWVADKSDIIESIIEIVERYARQGYKLTLRQLYYQLVSADAIPNNDKVYKRLGGILDDCRFSGKIDWNAIEDRGRVPYLTYYNESVQDAIESAASHFRLDRQDGQENVVEIWCEKDALSGILKRPAYEYHVRMVVNKGYSSSTAMYEAYQRFTKYYEQGKRVTILYFGDHDPSGLDMIRDIKERLTFMLCMGDFAENFDSYDATQLPIEFTYEEKQSILKSSHNNITAWIEALLGRYKDSAYSYLFSEETEIEKRLLIASNLSVKPIALTQAQIKQYNPPPNPAKIDDPRAKDYIAEYGNISWEVDALTPQTITQIVTDAIKEEIDMGVFDARMKEEASDLVKLKSLISKI
jgi:hypothetical protein